MPHAKLVCTIDERIVELTVDANCQATINLCRCKQLLWIALVANVAISSQKECHNCNGTKIKPHTYAGENCLATSIGKVSQSAEMRQKISFVR